VSGAGESPADGDERHRNGGAPPHRHASPACPIAPSRCHAKEPLRAQRREQLPSNAPCDRFVYAQGQRRLERGEVASQPQPGLESRFLASRAHRVANVPLLHAGVQPVRESAGLPRDPSSQRLPPALRPNCIKFSTCRRENLMQFGWGELAPSRAGKRTDWHSTDGRRPKRASGALIGKSGCAVWNVFGAGT